MTITTDEFLAHFGIKGMRWGRRKDTGTTVYYDSNYVAQPTKQQQLSTELDRRREYTVREISEKEYQSLDSKPVKIANSGETFKRLVATGDAHKLSDLAYVTKDENDHNTYIALWRPGSNANAVNKTSLTVTTSKAVVSPSKKERIDTFIETLGETIPDSSGKKSTTGREWVFGKEEPEHIKLLSNREAGLKYYQGYTQIQHLNTPITQVINSKYKQRGYTALEDDADKGLFSNSSVILFPKESGAKITEVKPLTSEEVRTAYDTVQLPNLN